jgi:hypothetical protein
VGGGGVVCRVRSVVCVRGGVGVWRGWRGAWGVGWRGDGAGVMRVRDREPSLGLYCLPNKWPGDILGDHKNKIIVSGPQVLRADKSSVCNA